MMNLPRIASWCIVTALLAISIAVAFNNAAAVQRGSPEGAAGVEVLTLKPIADDGQGEFSEFIQRNLRWH